MAQDEKRLTDADIDAYCQAALAAGSVLCPWLGTPVSMAHRDRVHSLVARKLKSAARATCREMERIFGWKD